MCTMTNTKAGLQLLLTNSKEELKGQFERIGESLLMGYTKFFPETSRTVLYEMVNDESLVRKKCMQGGFLEFR